MQCLRKSLTDSTFPDLDQLGGNWEIYPDGLSQVLLASILLKPVRKSWFQWISRSSQVSHSWFSPDTTGQIFIKSIWVLCSETQRTRDNIHRGVISRQFPTFGRSSHRQGFLQSLASPRPAKRPDRRPTRRPTKAREVGLLTQRRAEHREQQQQEETAAMIKAEAIKAWEKREREDGAWEHKAKLNHGRTEKNWKNGGRQFLLSCAGCVKLLLQ